MKQYTLVKEFPSRSSNAVYKVVRDELGNLSCDCRGWIFSGAKRECRHTREVGGVAPMTPATKKKAAKTHDSQVVKALTGLPVPGLDLPYFTPMLAQESNPEAVEERFISDEWIAEEKIDGARYLCYITKEGNRFFSRRISVKDGLPVEKTGNIPHLAGTPTKDFVQVVPDKDVKRIKGLFSNLKNFQVVLPESFKEEMAALDGTILDGEILPASGRFLDTTKIMGSLPLEAIEKQKKMGAMVYHVFDILFYKGKDLTSLPLEERLTYLGRIPSNDYLIPVKQIWGEGEKRKLYADIISRGGEGIILKHLKAPYRVGVRSKDTWMKVKRSRSFDVVVVGFEEPKQFSINVKGETVENKHYTRKQIAAIKFGAYKDGKLEEVGQCSGIDDTMREEISRNKSKYLGKVMVVEGQEFLKNAIRFPRFIQFRDDKNPADCKYEDLL